MFVNIELWVEFCFHQLEVHACGKDGFPVALPGHGAAGK